MSDGAGTSWADRGFVAVDWGSTARRAYAVDPGGRVSDEMEDDRGTLTLAPGEWAPAVAALRERFAGAPLLMAGMVGSNRGWKEAPYVACPAALPDVARALCWAEAGAAAIVPGLSLGDGEHPDVMRGEEVQVFGLNALEPGHGRTPICHPGTHTKWIDLDGRRLTRFRTVMTGELFSLLKQHSILADLLAEPAAVGPAFLAGVARGFASGALGAELFSVRAGVLLGASRREDAGSLASGLLIGCDIRAGLEWAEATDEIVVLGRGTLTELYAAALDHVGQRTRQVDGAAAFVAGMRAIAATIS